jgi:hypothetical protein
MPDIPAGSTLAYTFQNPINVATGGNVSLKVWVALAGDFIDFNDTLSVQFPLITGVANGNFIENFESHEDFPPNWASVNPDNEVGWVTTTNLPTPIVGPDDTEGRSVFINFFDYGPSLNGAEDYLYCVPVDLTGMDNPTLTFKVAYARYNATFFDGLRVEVFADCDLSGDPSIVWEKSNTELATVDDQTSIFFPTVSTNWRGELVSLNDFADKKSGHPLRFGERLWQQPFPRQHWRRGCKAPPRSF